MPDRINQEANEVPVFFSNADLKIAHEKRMKELKEKELKEKESDKPSEQ
jgi:hypothetical protein